MIHRLTLATFYLTVVIIMVPRCGIYAKADVIAGSPVYGEQRGGQVVAWGYAINQGTAPAKNAILKLTVLNAETESIIETHIVWLGDLAPGEKVKYEVILESVKWGDDVVYRTGFSWE